jgi:hypothetical protein
MWLHTSTDPTDAEWAAGCERMRKSSRDDNWQNHRAIVISDGGSPSAVQRRQLFASVYQARPIRMSVFTYALSSPFKRAVGTAITWFNPSLQFLTPEEAKKGFAHVELSRDVPELMRHLLTLQTELGPIRALRVLERVVSSPGWLEAF